MGKSRWTSWTPYGLCGCKSTLNVDGENRPQELWESRGGRPGLPMVSVDVNQH